MGVTGNGSMHITLIAITLLQISAVGSAVDFGEAGERMASAADGATYDPELLLLEEEEGWSTSFFVVVLMQERFVEYFYHLSLSLIALQQSLVVDRVVCPLLPNNVPFG